MKPKSEIRHYKPIPFKKITSLRVLGYFVLMLGPALFFYKQPENTPLLRENQNELYSFCFSKPTIPLFHHSNCGAKRS